MTKCRVMAALGLGCLGGASPAIAQSTCRPADAGSTRVAQDLSRAVAGTDEHSIQRRAVQHLPRGTGVQVELVNDESICTAALAAYEAITRSYDRATGEWSPAPHQLYLLRVDTVYVAWAPERSAGEFGQVVTLDRDYRVLASVLR